MTPLSPPAAGGFLLPQGARGVRHTVAFR